ncbi:response regulator transcription factor [Nitratifractor sp.]|uniref:response regulator transcription factor n=1 Tax=Nitratifractor sp. TaxID=2268144 RepID=UPI0025F6BC84|nr:response regulator transcription factor [Nitratifractor sp.]
MTRQEALKRLKVLYVEDEKSLAEMMEHAISRYFSAFRLAADGEEGLEIFQSFRPDLVITDITMPRMDGLEMGQHIHELSPETPLIILSAYSDKEKLLNAIDVGVSKYFIKPFDPEELLEYLGTLATRIATRQTIALRPDYRYDRYHRRLTRKGMPISLTAREQQFLEALLAEPGNFLDTAAIKSLLWPDDEPTDDAVRVFINRLRNKTGRELIRNRAGEGYYIEPE